MSLRGLRSPPIAAQLQKKNRKKQIQAVGRVLRVDAFCFVYFVFGFIELYLVIFFNSWTPFIHSVSIFDIRHNAD